MSIKLLTFKTNQTILGELDCTSDTEVTMKKPVQVIMQPTKEGPMMAFAPFLDYCDEFKTGVVINAMDILCTTTPVVELENQYSKMFGTGIEIASAIPKALI